MSATVAGTGPTYLDRIVPAVRRRLDERKRLVPPEGLAAAPLPDARSSFAAAIASPGLSLIAEVKRSSPSKGPIRPDLDVGGTVRAYQEAGARAVSVLTEEDFFNGSLADLREAAAHTDLPLLRKDFVVDGYQIREARAAGASAVLLIASLLDEGELRGLSGLAFDLGLDILLEVHDSWELERALAVDGAVIGINNRDLRTFVVSLETTARLAAEVPAGRLLVSESGIRTREDVEALATLGVDGVLVGESILRSADPQAAVTHLADGIRPAERRRPAT